MSQGVGLRVWRVAMVSLLVLSMAALGVRHVARVMQGPIDPMTLRVNGIDYRVLHVEQVSGLSDADLGGMSHGVNGLVGTDQAMVRVTLEVASPDAAAGYDTSVLRALAGSLPLSPVAGSMKRGSLRRGGHVEGALSYIVPRNGAQLRLTAPGQGAVSLIRVDTGGSSDGHDHTASGSPTIAHSPPSTTSTKQVKP